LQWSLTAFYRAHSNSFSLLTLDLTQNFRLVPMIGICLSVANSESLARSVGSVVAAETKPTDASRRTGSRIHAPVPGTSDDRRARTSEAVTESVCPRNGVGPGHLSRGHISEQRATNALGMRILCSSPAIVLTSSGHCVWNFFYSLDNDPSGDTARAIR
jgi:hypothetical protein